MERVPPLYIVVHVPSDPEGIEWHLGPFSSEPEAAAFQARYAQAFPGDAVILAPLFDPAAPGTLPDPAAS